jgi:hypothetical protein
MNAEMFWSCFAAILFAVGCRTAPLLALLTFKRKLEDKV